MNLKQARMIRRKVIVLPDETVQKTDLSNPHCG